MFYNISVPNSVLHPVSPGFNCTLVKWVAGVGSATQLPSASSVSQALIMTFWAAVGIPVAPVGMVRALSGAALM